MVNIYGIVAMDNSGGIGKDNTLPWPPNKEDMAWFKEATDNSIVVMGYNTWLSLPKKLPNRTNVVISRSEVPNADETIISRNDSIFYYMEEILKIHTRNPFRKDIFVIGGKKTYEFLLPAINKWYISQIDGDYDCDTKMSKKDLTNEFSVVTYNKLSENTSLEVYQRRKNKL